MDKRSDPLDTQSGKELDSTRGKSPLETMVDLAMNTENPGTVPRWMQIDTLLHPLVLHLSTRIPCSSVQRSSADQSSVIDPFGTPFWPLAPTYSQRSNNY